ncbi:unnamed protein product [Penicillium salamii]|uniref:Amino acid transporter transmembrane domain-containing protein n=1 Tax=Penicillium salamii TaxID=1612424 RepID=A0A9W4NP67_9EURO|nr:unnamed protein product [Penicillium salamii]CAG8175908.1 unnamed protein product [Penicillium salamii]CAG8206409.1 unnamed protein product [Penicillium salamii]CAG8235997.1 unnamed protein product [Penicillium salamii]CAG8306048.1 unnamed protein product [Penicillium salamii]
MASRQEEPEWLQADESQATSDDLKKSQEPDADGTDPFGNEEEGEVQYRTMSWVQCAILMIAENISLGILSFPSAVATLGMVPAAVILVFLSVLSWYTGLLIGQFKLRYPQVHSMADAGGVLWGPIGREIVGIGQLLLLVFFMSSHILTFSILLNVLTGHGACSIAFGVVGLILSFLMSLPRTMEKVFWFAITSFISIFIATVVLMISVGVEAKGPIQNDVVRADSFYKAFLAVTNIIFAYIAHIAYFGFISETKQPRDYPKSLALLHIVETTLYLVSALIIYHYVGQDVKSPALSSAGPLMRKVCYGIAIPTVLIAGVIAGHVACKNIYIRLFRGSSHLHKRSMISVGSWVGIALVLWIVAWVIAESIPSFNDLLSLISSIFGSVFSYILPAVFWLHLNRGRYFSTTRKTVLTIVNVVILAIGFAIAGLGLYVSARSLSESTTNLSWSCADNS